MSVCLSVCLPLCLSVRPSVFQTCSNEVKCICDRDFTGKDCSVFDPIPKPTAPTGPEKKGPYLPLFHCPPLCSLLTPLPSLTHLTAAASSCLCGCEQKLTLLDGHPPHPAFVLQLFELLSLLLSSATHPLNPAKTHLLPEHVGVRQREDHKVILRSLCPGC